MIIEESKKKLHWDNLNLREEVKELRRRITEVQLRNDDYEWIIIKLYQIIKRNNEDNLLLIEKYLNKLKIFIPEEEEEINE